MNQRGKRKTHKEKAPLLGEKENLKSLGNM